MKKVDWQQAERKVNERLKGGLSLWDRIINDPEFKKRKRVLQTRYNLPLDFDMRLDYNEWLRWIGYGEMPTSRNAKRGKAFLADVHILFKKFEVPESWHDDFIGEIWGKPRYRNSADSWSFPKFELTPGAEGNLKWRCIITPETDLTNPMILSMIQEQQKEHAGNPPKPIKDILNPRKLDWRPVYEWYKRHPLFTHEEIANKIGYSSQTVRRAFAKLEKSN